MSLVRLATRMQNVEPSPTVRLNALAQELIKSGKDVVNLTAGETDFETAENIRNAAIKAMNEGVTKYTAPHGMIELRNAVSQWFERDFGLKYPAKQITVTVGVKQGIFNLILATISEGDEVIIPAPYWVSYPEMVRIAGGVPVVVPSGERFGLPSLKKYITPKTRLILLNSPNNPSGGMYTEDQMRALARELEGSNILVSSDEIYSSLVYDQTKFISFAALSEDAFKRTITFNGLSKSHAMTGWRVGYAAGPLEIIEAMGILQAQSSTHITSFVQVASIEALKQSAQDFAPKLKDMQHRRDFVVDRLQQIKGVKLEKPAGAFYVFPDLSAHMAKLGGASEKMAEYLLQDAGVVLVPGKPFGDDQKVRISFAKDLKTLEKGLGRIRDSLQKLIP